MALMRSGEKGEPTDILVLFVIFVHICTWGCLVPHGDKKTTYDNLEQDSLRFPSSNLSFVEVSQVVEGRKHFLRYSANTDLLALNASVSLGDKL